MTLAHIAEWLNNKGYTTPRGKTFTNPPSTFHLYQLLQKTRTIREKVLLSSQWYRCSLQQKCGFWCRKRILRAKDTFPIGGKIRPCEQHIVPLRSAGGVFRGRDKTHPIKNKVSLQSSYWVLSKLISLGHFPALCALQLKNAKRQPRTPHSPWYEKSGIAL